MKWTRYASSWLVLLLCASSVSAATFTVDDLSDALDETPGDGLCATLLGGCTLRAAVMESNALAGRDLIALPHADVVGLTLSGPGEDSAAAGDLDVLDDLEIRGSDSWIFGGVDDRLIHIAPNVHLEISGVTLSGGDVGEDGAGGVILNEGSLTIRHCRIERGIAGDGAGIANSGRLHLLTSAVVDNTATGFGPRSGRGGGIYSTGDLVIANSQIIDNSSLEFGGGVFSSSTELEISNATIRGNSSHLGGGIYATGQVSVRNSTLAENLASMGGGIFSSAGELLIRDSTISRNSAELTGGGIECDSCVIHDSTLSGNNSEVAALFAGQLLMVNSTISGNAGSENSGIAATNFDIASSTITRNFFTSPPNSRPREVISGTGILRNTIVADNAAGDCHAASNITSGGYNLIGDGDSCPGVNERTDLRGSEIDPLDPRLGALGANRGPTLTHLPLPDSPAIDAGNPRRPGRVSGACPRRDQRGVKRPRDGDGSGRRTCDIGAVER